MGPGPSVVNTVSGPRSFFAIYLVLLQRYYHLVKFFLLVRS